MCGDDIGDCNKQVCMYTTCFVHVWVGCVGVVSAHSIMCVGRPSFDFAETADRSSHNATPCSFEEGRMELNSGRII